MLTSCSMGYYANNGMGLSTIANISVQPAWGPAGYDCAHYYYFPDYNFYYDVNRALFYYHQNKRWISAKHLPYGLGYPRDLYRLYKVVLNNVRNPWNYNRRHISEYKHFRGVHTQPVLRPDNRPSHNNGYRIPYNDNRPQPGYGKPNNNNRPPQQPGYGTPQNGSTPPQMQQGDNYGSKSNTIRGSRNNNTSRNNVAPQRGNGANSNKVQPSQQRPKAQGQPQSSVRGGTNKSQSNVSSSKGSGSRGKGNTRSSNSSSSSGGSRSSGSRGR